ncbi:SPASM domain-containing protein [Pseudodesulfovibrio sp.]|uniref:SPASM domain-containing protein n=1 Tax=unclassified Pseudodesulfovibrio TaxID=2661612 RepID=UPI003B0068BA
MQTFDNKPCYEPWEYMLINQDGKVAMCCSNCVGGGDLKTQSFDEVWNAELVQELRRNLNTDHEPKACANCLTYKRNKEKAVELREDQQASMS